MAFSTKSCLCVCVLRLQVVSHTTLYGVVCQGDGDQSQGLGLAPLQVVNTQRCWVRERGKKYMRGPVGVEKVFGRTSCSWSVRRRVQRASETDAAAGSADADLVLPSSPGLALLLVPGAGRCHFVPSACALGFKKPCHDFIHMALSSGGGDLSPWAGVVGVLCASTFSRALLSPQGGRPDGFSRQAGCTSHHLVPPDARPSQGPAWPRSPDLRRPHGQAHPEGLCGPRAPRLPAGPRGALLFQVRARAWAAADSQGPPHRVLCS